MKILITGGHGFIGQNIAERYYSKNCDVVLYPKGKNIVDIDREVIDCDYIFHCASTVHNYHMLDKYCLDLDTNCYGTLSLLEACKRHNSSAKIIYTSTFFVYGNQKNLPVTEDTLPNPQGLYPATKLASENFLKIYSNVWGIDTVIARLTNVYGLGEQTVNNKKAAFNRMAYDISQGKTVGCYNYKGKDYNTIERDYIHVNDVVDGLELLAEVGDVGEIYNLGTGRSIQFRIMLDLMIEFAKCGSYSLIDIPDFHKKVGIDDFSCKIDKIKQLGFNPKISIEDGIEMLMKNYKNG
jgi:UDP-glucose 4-epimerase